MEQRKAKRKLSSIDFSGSESHMALVHKDQGGPASGAAYKLVLKAVRLSEDQIETIAKSGVTLEVNDYVQKFFTEYNNNTEVLAKALGSPESDLIGYDDFITSRIESIDVLKALQDTDQVSTVLSELEADEYMSFIKNQATLEKAFNVIEKQAKQAKQTKEQPVIKSQETESELVVKTTETDTSHVVHEVSEVKSSVITNKSKEPNMTKEIKVDEPTKIEKSATELSLELLQKSFDESRVELQKAQELIAEFKKEKQEQIQKSKTAQFAAVIKDEKILAPIVKAALTLESEDDFTAFLAAVTSMQTNIETTQGFIEKSALFQEQGASTSEEPKEKESAVARILKSKQTK
jgi:hypothetical protein